MKLITCNSPEVQRLLEALGLQNQSVMELTIRLDPGRIVTASAELTVGQEGAEELATWTWVAQEARPETWEEELNRRFDTLEKATRRKFAALKNHLFQMSAMGQARAPIRSGSVDFLKPKHEFFGCQFVPSHEKGGEINGRRYRDMF